MPEEAPEEQVIDDMPDAPEGAARETALRHLRGMRQRGSAPHDEADRDHGAATGLA